MEGWVPSMGFRRTFPQKFFALLDISGLDKTHFPESPEDQLESLGLPLSLAKAMVTTGRRPTELARLLGRSAPPTRNCPQELHPLWLTVDETLAAFARTRDAEALKGLLGSRPTLFLRGELRKLKPQGGILYVFGEPGAGKTYAMERTGGHDLDQLRGLTATASMTQGRMRGDSMTTLSRAALQRCRDVTRPLVYGQAAISDFREIARSMGMNCICLSLSPPNDVRHARIMHRLELKKPTWALPSCAHPLISLLLLIGP